jgi:hypothetical protein
MTQRELVPRVLREGIASGTATHGGSNEKARDAIRRIAVRHVLAEADLVVALTTVNARTNEISASYPEEHVWRMKAGKAIEFGKIQGDEQREDQFWS